MSYLLDKKLQRKKIFFSIFIIVFFGIIFYFRFSVFNNLSNLTIKIFRPFVISGNNIIYKFQDLRSYFLLKNSLLNENQNLKNQIENDKLLILNYNSLLLENNDLKMILNRKTDKKSMILSAILAKPNQSLYDTLIIDAGIKQGIKQDAIVFANGNIPVGRVAVVYENTSKVILFSSSGEKNQVIVSGKNIYMILVGRGGGNFEIILPKDFVLNNGDQVVLPGITPYVVGIVDTTISDPRDPFVKALLSSPVNIQELKFVEVEM